MPLPVAGDRAPTLILPDQNSHIVDLARFQGQMVVLYFYPKDMTPGCTIQANDFNDNLSALSSQEVVVLGVSRDSLPSHRQFREKFDLGFDLLSDEDGAVCQAWGVWRERKFLGRFLSGIIRSTFLIDSTGVILRVWSPVAVEGHVAEVMTAVRKAREGCS